MWMFVFGLLCSFGTVLSLRAAVYEHVVISPDEPWRNFTRDEAFNWMLKNLEIFEEQTATAAQQVSLLHKTDMSTLSESISFYILTFILTFYSSSAVCRLLVL